MRQISILICFGGKHVLVMLMSAEAEESRNLASLICYSHELAHMVELTSQSAIAVCVCVCFLYDFAFIFQVILPEG